MNTKSSGMSGNETVGQLLRVWRARRARGVTLVEVLIVVAIIAMVAGGVAVFPSFLLKSFTWRSRYERAVLVRSG